MKEKFVISERDKKEYPGLLYGDKLYPAMNIMWYIEDIRAFEIIVRVWILRQVNWVLASIWKESNYGLTRVRDKKHSCTMLSYEHTSSGGYIEFLGYTPEMESLLEKERQDVIVAHRAWQAKQVQIT